MISENMLREKYLLNVNIIESIRRGTAEILFQSMDGILIKDIEADLYLISAESMESAKKAIMFIPREAKLILAHQKFYCSLIEEKCNVKCSMSTYHAVWTSLKHIKIPDFEGELKSLTLDNLKDVKENYKMFEVVGEENIKNSIIKNKLIGAFINNNLCGFIGEHEEGSIGMLEVFGEYRRRGIGAILESAAINKALDEGRIPFGEVIIDNEISLRLQKKIGLEISREKLYWME